MHDRARPAISVAHRFPPRHRRTVRLLPDLAEAAQDHRPVEIGGLAELQPHAGHLARAVFLEEPEFLPVERLECRAKLFRMREIERYEDLGGMLAPVANGYQWGRLIGDLGRY